MQGFRGAAVLVAAAALAAACLAPPGLQRPPQVGTSDLLTYHTDPTDRNLTEDTYWLVRLVGSETHEVKSGDAKDRVATCREEWRYDLDIGNTTLRYDARFSAHPVEGFTTVVLLDYVGVSFASTVVSTGCPSAYGVHSFVNMAEVTANLTHFGDVNLKVFPQGALGLQDKFVLPLGKGGGYEFTRVDGTHATEYWVFGDWRVENLGAWPKAGLAAETR